MYSVNNGYFAVTTNVERRSSSTVESGTGTAEKPGKRGRGKKGRGKSTAAEVLAGAADNSDVQNGRRRKGKRNKSTAASELEPKLSALTFGALAPLNETNFLPSLTNQSEISPLSTNFSTEFEKIKSVTKSPRTLEI